MPSLKISPPLARLYRADIVRKKCLHTIKQLGQDIVKLQKEQARTAGYLQSKFANLPENGRNILIQINTKSTQESIELQKRLIYKTLTILKGYRQMFYHFHR